MLAADQTASEFTLPSLDLRAVARRAALPAVLGAAAAATVILAGGRISAVAAALHRVMSVNGYWTVVGIAFECLSLAGYVAVLALIAGRATQRIGVAESAQITLAGAAATRLLPTAGAGGAALTLWSLRRAGLRTAVAARTLLVFLVALYSVFLVAIVVSGGALSLGLVNAHGPVALAAIAAGVALVAIVVALALAARRRTSGGHAHDGQAGGRADGRQVARLKARIDASFDLLAGAVRDACRLLRSPDARLAGAVAYWGFDAAVLWAMLHAFGAAPALPVVVLAYFVGQVANTLPLPGSVSGGIAGVLIAFGVPAAVALPAVLAYRTIAVWLPVPVAIAAIPRLRATTARWAAEDAPVPESETIPGRVESRALRAGADRMGSLVTT
jgi:uncharacterized membrane protein YbhN (UPF0104 family)